MILLHWKKNVIILTKFSSLAAPKVVILTTFGAASDEDFIKMKTFSFQCCGPIFISLNKGLCARNRYLSGAWISNYIQQILWDVIMYPCPRYLLLAHTPLYKDLCDNQVSRAWMSNQILQYCVGYNYLSLYNIYASCTQALTYGHGS